MHLILSLLTLTPMALASPLVTPLSPSSSTTKTCTISSQTIVNCRAGPNRDYPLIRTTRPGQAVDIECIVDGEAIDGEKCVHLKGD